MKYSKVCSILQRGIEVDELVSEYLFGGKIPTKFIQGDTYKLGDMVYTVNYGDLNIYQCMKSGVCEDVENDPNWVIPEVGDITSGQGPALAGIVKISTDEPEGGLIWIRPSTKLSVCPDIML